MCACFMTSGESLPLQTSISSLASRETVVFSELLGLLFLTYKHFIWLSLIGLPSQGRLVD